MYVSVCVCPGYYVRMYSQEYGSWDELDRFINYLSGYFLHTWLIHLDAWKTVSTMIADNNPKEYIQTFNKILIHNNLPPVNIPNSVFANNTNNSYSSPQSQDIFAPSQTNTSTPINANTHTNILSHSANTPFSSANLQIFATYIQLNSITLNYIYLKIHLLHSSSTS